MTVLTNPITFNSGTGSDTAASGSGPSTAVAGTGASTNNTTTVDLSADTPDLSGVSAGDLLWVGSSSGRQFSVIASVDDGADTVTCDDTYTQTESGRNWGIGGKRATFDNADSRTVFADYKGDWIVETETDQTITGSTISITGDSTTLVIRSDGTTIRTLTGTMNDSHFDSSAEPMFDTLKFESTSGTKTATSAVDGTVAAVFLNCILGDATNTMNVGSEVRFAFLVNSEVVENTGNGVQSQGNLELYGCWVHDNGGDGVDINTDSFNIVDSVISKNGGTGCNLRGNGIITGCVIDENTGDGLEMRSNTNYSYRIINNQITKNGGYGINAIASLQANTIVANNNFGTGADANTSGDTNGLHANSRIFGNLNVDPQYTARASDNWEGGLNTQDAGYPLKTTTIGANQSATKLFTSIGIEQEHAAGGLLVHPGTSGGARG